MCVVAPTLIGLGERADKASPQTGLQTHVDQIEELLEADNVRDGVLVGHSYGGMLLSGIADRAPDRVRWLVYLDALIPEDGQSCFDLMPGVEAAFQASASPAAIGTMKRSPSGVNPNRAGTL